MSAPVYTGYVGSTRKLSGKKRVEILRLRENHMRDLYAYCQETGRPIPKDRDFGDTFGITNGGVFSIRQSRGIKIPGKLTRGRQLQAKKTDWERFKAKVFV